MVTINQVSNKTMSEKASLVVPRLALSVIVPTRNEAGNVEKLLSGIQNAFGEQEVEVIFVDDSTDNTPQVVENAVGQFPKQHVHLIHREPEERVGGLGGAVVAGLKAAKSEYACVMDGDLQHPPEVVPVLLKTELEKHADMVVATRRNEASHVSGLNTARNLISKGLDLIARIFFGRRLRGISDPLTGFFLVRVASIDLNKLHPNGFKILMEILVRNPNLKKAEVPFNFAERFAGESKASAAEAIKYLKLLWTLRFGEGSLRFIGFGLVGLTGIGINSLAIFLATDRLKIHYLVSVGIATVVSTIWNFVFTEALVFKARNRTSGRVRRFGLFLGMNMLALAFRAPLVYLLTSTLGIYYVISNLISLLVLTLVRFLLADNFIWGQAHSATENQKQFSGARKAPMKKANAYNIHNIISINSESPLPELEPFRVLSEFADPTIRVKIGFPRAKKSTDKDGDYMRYREIFGHLGFEVGIQMGDPTIDIVAAPMLRLSPHVLYTNVVEPLLRWTFVKKGYALVHGATIAFGNSAYMITARTDTGKTTTLLKILAYQRRNGDRAAFLSDDMTILSADGTAYTYPKPLTISYHTLKAVNSDTLVFKEKLTLPFQSRIHSRSGRKVAFLVSKTHLPAATINMLTQMVVPPPKYFVNKLVPNVKLAKRAEMTGMFIIERGQEKIQPITNSEAMEILLQNCEDAYGFPPYENLKEFMYCFGDFDLHEKEYSIIREAMSKLPATVIRSDSLDWWSQIPTYVNDELVSKDITRALQVEIAPHDRYNRKVERISIQ